MYKAHPLLLSLLLYTTPISQLTTKVEFVLMPQVRLAYRATVSLQTLLLWGINRE